jgi:hypothetical protein
VLHIFDWLFFHYFLLLIFRLTPLTSAISRSKIMQHCSYLGCHLGELVIKTGSLANSFKLAELESLRSSSFLKKLVENGSSKIQDLIILKSSYLAKITFNFVYRNMKHPVEILGIKQSFTKSISCDNIPPPPPLLKIPKKLTAQWPQPLWIKLRHSWQIQPEIKIHPLGPRKQIKYGGYGSLGVHNLS